ncbi:hypothetical protein [Chitinolyticbacter albus]|uniref:hypothetical protein n=1 Tax=Chitinolyticbacter albus TaxID=2961951 RepID=UPI002108B233|nr:hypothetical protein [Chitinolyticbacter albus]
MNTLTRIATVIAGCTLAFGAYASEGGQTATSHKVAEGAQGSTTVQYKLTQGKQGKSFTRNTFAEGNQGESNVRPARA